MTQEKLLERLKALSTDLDTTLANANALRGAIQDTQYWLSQVGQEESLTGVEQQQESKPRKKLAVVAKAE